MNFEIVFRVNGVFCNRRVIGYGIYFKIFKCGRIVVISMLKLINI